MRSEPAVGVAESVTTYEGAVGRPGAVETAHAGSSSGFRESVYARARHRYGVCLGLVLLGYVLVVGSLLAATDGFPYVLDNNESFSSL